MRIFMTTPDFSVHGGIRVILEWANRLSARHYVVLRTLGNSTKCTWFPLSRKVKVTTNDKLLTTCDTVLLTSPHSIHYQERVKKKPVFLFMQMAEHLFRSGDSKWFDLCKRFYRSPHPMFLISDWNRRLLIEDFGRTAPTHYIGNGVNLEHFPIESIEKEFDNVVLVEGWPISNASKDVDRVAPRVAAKLRADGCKILAYSQQSIRDYRDVPHEYYVKPPLDGLNDLYRRATILLKASRYDARACAPVEAMTKGTVTARAIIDGDDDLIHEENCLRTTYDVDSLYAIAKQLLDDKKLRMRLAENCHRHVQTYTWDHWIDQVERILQAS